MIFQKISTSYYRLFGNAKLRPYEQVCLDSWKRHLSPIGKTILDKQLARFDFVQRQSKEKMTCFYQLADKSLSKWPLEIFFANKGEEVTAATIWLQGTGGASKRSKFRADISLFHGRLFCIQFNKQPREFFGSEFASVVPAVADVNIWTDPMSEAPVAEPLASEAPLRGWLESWRYRQEIAEIRAPVPALERERLIQMLGTSLPSDYLDLTEQADGFRVRSCRVVGLADLRAILLPEATYYILAESEGRADFGVAQGSTDRVIFRLDVEDETPHPVATSIREVLEAELAALQGEIPES